MNEATHLLLTEQSATDSNNNIQTAEIVQTDDLADAKKEKNWFEQYMRTAFLSQRSMKDIKHDELLAGNIGTAACLIRDAVLGDAYAIEDPTIGATIHSLHPIRRIFCEMKYQ